MVYDIHHDVIIRIYFLHPNVESVSIYEKLQRIIFGRSQEMERQN